ncbi:stigma-specific STIG1-like protein 1 [Rosa sericea]
MDKALNGNWETGYPYKSIAALQSARDYLKKEVASTFRKTRFVNQVLLIKRIGEVEEGLKAMDPNEYSFSNLASARQELKYARRDAQRKMTEMELWAKASKWCSSKLTAGFAMLMMASAGTLSATLDEEESSFFNEDNNVQNQEKTSLRGTSSVFFASRAVTASTCDKNPKVCGAAVAGGSECCSKKCVDLKTDRLNCGKCGVKCKQTEICCNGHIVTPMSDKKNCGRCNNACKGRNSCAFGMCSYA